MRNGCFIGADVNRLASYFTGIQGLALSLFIRAPVIGRAHVFWSLAQLHPSHIVAGVAVWMLDQVFLVVFLGSVE